MNILQKIVRIYKLNKLKKQLAVCGNNVSFDSVEQIMGGKFIHIGNNCSFCKGLVLTAWEKYQKDIFTPSIIIGNDCHFGMYNHITSINRIVIGTGLLTGKWVTITDNSHGNNLSKEMNIPPAERNLFSKGDVVIGNNVWIGDKATILPNVKIGNGAVIAANAVVTKDVPAFTVVAGIPAKVVKNIKICQNQD